MKKQSATTAIIGCVFLLMLIGAFLTWAQETSARVAENISTWISKFQWEEASTPIAPYTWEPFGSRYKTFFSPTVNKTVSYLLWLPPGYASSTKRYPVVYWLPGAEGDQFQVASFLQDLEAAVNAGQAPEMIVVGVNAIVCCSFYVDSFEGHLPLETVIIQDLIPHIDSTYRTLAQRKFRAVEGFSMGGFGALHLGFKYPEVFGAVSDHAGAIYDAAEGRAALCCNNIYRSWNYAFGADETYFNANSPYTLALQNADSIRGKTIIRVMVGQLDNATLNYNLVFHNYLTSLNIGHEYQIVPGATHDKFAYYGLLGFSAFNPFYLQAFSGAPALPQLRHSPTPTPTPTSTTPSIRRPRE